MDTPLRRLVRKRASDCCEYCRLHQAYLLQWSFHVEHIIAKQKQEVIFEQAPK